MKSQEPRRDFSLPVPVELVRGDGAESQEYAVNLSPRGLCLHHREPLAVGERIVVRFALPGDPETLEAPGMVVWSSAEESDEDAGQLRESGVHLLDLDDEMRERLRLFASQPINRRR
jgi:Tfp pilus assembly protein PilZ